ncbi:MAG: MotE family protein, partial [Thermacetogeniaceae bacterium]
ELSQNRVQKTANPASQQTSPVNTEESAKLYRQLADYYSGMKPAAAVAILKNLDPQLVAEILKAMDREQAGQILAAMDPAKAARLIELIATSEGSAGTR